MALTEQDKDDIRAIVQEEVFNSGIYTIVDSLAMHFLYEEVSTCRPMAGSTTTSLKITENSAPPQVGGALRLDARFVVDESLAVSSAISHLRFSIVGRQKVGNDWVLTIDPPMPFAPYVSETEYYIFSILPPALHPHELALLKASPVIISAEETAAPAAPGDAALCRVYVDLINATASTTGTLTISRLPAGVAWGGPNSQTKTADTATGRITYDPIPKGATFYWTCPAASVRAGAGGDALPITLPQGVGVYRIHG